MKQVILWCRLSKISDLCRKIVSLRNDIKAVGLWIDNEELLKEKSIAGLPVYNYKDIMILIKEGKIDGILLSALKANYTVGDTIFDRASLFLEQGIKDIYVIPATLEKMPECEMTKKDKDNFIVDFKQFSEPMTIKFLASESCNLNCSGCTHFAPLIESPKMLSVEECERDLQQVKKIFQYVKIIQFLGGEPLLNKRLPELIEKTHDIFPYTDIHVLTNGLLIPTVEQKLFDVMKRYDVWCSVSVYPPTAKIIEQICRRLEGNQIRYTLFGEIKEFRLQYNTLGNRDMYENYYNCPDRICHTIVDGKLSNCYYAVMVPNANKYFGINIPYENCIYDLYDTSYTGAELLKKINSPSSMCSYCNGFSGQMSKWKIMTKNATLKEWFLNN